MGYKLFLGEKVQSQLMVKDVKLLGPENNHHAHEIEEAENSCSNEKYDYCIYEALARVMKENTKDNCTVPYMRNKKICKNPDDIKTAFDIHWNRVTNQQKDCKFPCHSLNVNLGGKNYENKTVEKQPYGVYYMYFPPRVTTLVERSLYTPLNLFAEVGGYLGLLLGFSLHDLISWIIKLIEAKFMK